MIVEPVLSMMHAIQRFWRDTSGIVLVYALVVLLPILGMSGLAVDSAHLTYFKTRMQNTSDAAALAALVELPKDTFTMETALRDAIVTTARQYAHANMKVDLYGDVMPVSAVTVGFMDKDGEIGPAGAFYAEALVPEGVAFNAVRTEVRRTSSNGNAVRNMFIAAIGGETSDVVASSIARMQERITLPPCLDGGFVSLGDTSVQSNTLLLRGMCMHADSNSTIGQNACVQLGAAGVATVFSVQNTQDASIGSGATYVEEASECNTMFAQPLELDDYLIEATFKDYLVNPEEFIFDLSLPANDPGHITAIEDYIDNFRGSEDDPGWPDCPGFPATQTGSVAVTLDIDDPGYPCVVIVDGDLQLKRSTPIAYDNIMILVKGSVTFASDTRIGIEADCNTLEAGNMIVASEGGGGPAKLEFFGTQMIFGDDFTPLGASSTVVGSTILSAGDISTTSNWTMEGCQDTVHAIEFEDVSDDPPPVRKLVY